MFASSPLEQLSCAMSRLRDRRSSIRLLGGGLLGTTLLAALDAEAEQRKRGHRKNGPNDRAKAQGNSNRRELHAEGKKKRSTFCHNGQTVTTASKKKRKQLVNSGATPGACAPEAASCSSHAQCGVAAICAAGRCQRCTVTCNGDGMACGTALQQRLSQGGTIYICPGRYVGRFGVGAAKIIGAGAGENPATSTILDAQGMGRTLSLADSMTVSLANVRITGGRVSEASGGGVYASNCDLTLSSCAIEGSASLSNGGGLAIRGGRLQMQSSTVVSNASGAGGGLILYAGAKARVVDSRFELNTASGPGASNTGGGIYLAEAELTTTRCEFSRNSAEDGGGGIATEGTRVVLTLDSATRIVNNSAGPTRGGGGGILNEDGSEVNINGAVLEGNTPNNYRTYP